MTFINEVLPGMIALKHETEFAIANFCELIAIEPRNVRIIQEILTGTRPVEATENVHQRRFA